MIPRGHRRTTVVAVLAAVAVLVPSAAWWAAGSAEAERRAEGLLEAARGERLAALEAAAERLGDRLETLRAAEEARPFYHYQNLYHEPRGASRGPSVVPSPLSAGSLDPLVGAHFQVDERGRVGLPAVNERFPELSSEAGYAAYCSFMAELEAGVVVADGTVDGDWSGPAAGERLVRLDRSAWDQIRAADDVYAAIRGLDGSVPATAVVDETGSDVVVAVGELRWHTMVTPSGPLLAALRRVRTPDGVVVQGFSIAGEAVETALARPGFAPRLVERAGPDEPASPVADTGWQLIAAGGGGGPDRAAATEVVAAFRRRFALGALAACLAAVAVVGLVAESDRLARQRTRFAATAAHELRTPLASLRLYSEMLAEGLGDPAKAEQYAARIAGETARLGRVVGNILDLSRLERGSLTVEPHPGDLAPVVETTVEGLRPALERSGLELELDLAEEVPTQLFDGDAVAQILANLLDNAERHTRANAARRVTVHLVADGEGCARVTVADSGPGVAPAERRRLFSPFRHSSSGDGSGLGLGLALGRSLARAQGGDLILETTPAGAGARFTLLVRRA